MLTITIPEIEQYDEKNNEFFSSKEQTLQLEHSLVSVSKWESKWHKPFLTKQEKTVEESIDYIKCMTMTQNVDPEIYKFIDRKIIAEVRSYIEAPMTATTFNEEKKTGGKEIVTAEVIYYWMVAMNIPFECQKWHFNRLLTLINVCNIKNKPPKKMSKKEVMSRNQAINNARRNSMNSKG